MGALMELVAGDTQAILVVVASDELTGLSEPGRFVAHLSLGAGLDPTWLDLFSEAVRSVLDSAEPNDFLDARRELDGPGEISGRTVERVDRRWIETIARLHDRDIAAIAGRWLDLLDDELGELPREEKPWIRGLAGDIVEFCRAAERAPDVLFAWSL
ncbi:MAG: hypothetical protein QOF11_484 [Chloroflexota bacterium]|jgi:hypothetical protein|nr:hypothetical protein [Chloroflexota bacterium]